MKDKIDQLSRPIVVFGIKATIVTILGSIVLNFFIPDFSETWENLSQKSIALEVGVNNILKEEKTKLYALSFIQNPAVLYKVSEIEEHNGKLGNAIRAMELAIGLLEMHGAEKHVIKRYQDRLEKLSRTSKSS